MGTVQQMVLKRSADRFVNEGWDVTETDDLIAVLESRGTSIKLLKITEEQVKYIENELPITLKLITNKMQIYQVFTKLFFFRYVLMISKIAFNQTILSFVLIHPPACVSCQAPILFEDRLAFNIFSNFLGLIYWLFPNLQNTLSNNSSANMNDNTFCSQLLLFWQMHALRFRIRLQFLSNQLTQMKKGTFTALSGSTALSGRFGVLLRWTRAWTAHIVISV